MSTISTVDLFRGGFPIHVGVVLVALTFAVVILRRRRRARRSSDGPDALASTARSLPTESADIASRVAHRRATAVATKAVETSPPARPVAWTKESPGDWAVETRGLTKRFGTTVAVNDVELLVPRGSAFGYLGPNGAGKTTLIRTLLGLTRPDSGTMSLLAVPVPSERSRALARVGAIVDEPRFHPHLTARENLGLLAAARGGQARARIAPSLARVGLAERADHKVATYSMGMRQRLGVASCLLGDPQTARVGRAHERARPGRHTGDAGADCKLRQRGTHGGAVLASSG